MERLGRLIEGRPRQVVAAAVAAVAVAVGLGAGAAAKLDPFGVDDPATESVVADGRLEHAGFREPDVVVLVRGADPRTTAGRARVLGVERRLRRDDDVASVAGYLETRSPDFLSRAGDATYLAVGLRPLDDRERQDAAARLSERLADDAGVVVGGAAAAERALNEQVEHDLRTAELYAFPLLFLLSLFFFRSVVAALLPLLLGGFAIVGALAVLRIASTFTSVSIFALNVATGIGLGLAVDYSLFVVSRFREEAARSGHGAEALRRTLATAGRTVLFSSLTVAASLASLLVFPQRFLYSMAIGGAAAALLAALASLTLLPALLLLLGPRVDALSPRVLRRRGERDARPARSGAWYRLARLVGRRPGAVAAVTVVALVGLGLPSLGLRFTAADTQVLPASADARAVDTALQREFPPHRTTPIRLVASGAGEARRAALAAASQDGVAAVRPPRMLGDGVGHVDVIPTGAPLSTETKELVRRLRALPGDTAVTGTTAHYLDMQESLGEHLPYALLIVLAVTVALLFAMSGSLVLPLIQIAMNVLGLAAMYGVLVALFQHGVLASEPGLEAPQLLLLFATAFGLSTDYGVFLFARMKELRDGGLATADAVAVGIERTGRLVTAAALLFAVAFGAFLSSKIVLVQELGVGTATAVLVDASIVRALLVPALVHLLGGATWWAPRPLRRLHARLRLGEA